MLGAEVRAVPAVPWEDAQNYNHQARRYAQERGGFWADQFDNRANRQGHFQSTGPELWQQVCNLN